MILSLIPCYSIIPVLRQLPSICKLIMITKASSALLIVLSCMLYDLSHMVTLTQLPFYTITSILHPSTIQRRQCRKCYCNFFKNRTDGPHNKPDDLENLLSSLKLIQIEEQSSRRKLVTP